MSTRIYSIQNEQGELVSLVRAGTKNGALRHVAETMFTVRVAEQDALVWGIQNGIKIEDAQAKAEEPAEEATAG